MVVRKPKHELFATDNESDPGLSLFFRLVFLPCQSIAKTECRGGLSTKMRLDMLFVLY